MDRGAICHYDVCWKMIDKDDANNRLDKGINQ